MNAVAQAPQTATELPPISIAELPRIGTVTEHGKYAGNLRGPADGTDYAIFDGGESEAGMPFAKAVEWQVERGGLAEISLEIGRLLDANIDKPEGRTEWMAFWLKQHEGLAGYAWFQLFVAGDQYSGHKGDGRRARVIRRRAIQPFSNSAISPSAQ